MNTAKRFGLLGLLAAWSAFWAAAPALARNEAGADEPMLLGLGDLPGGWINSAALGVSADGSVVVGSGIGADGMEAFRWTRSGGMAGLGFVHAAGISADGRVVVGCQVVGYGVAAHAEAVRRGPRSQVVLLGTLPGCHDSDAMAVSADGSVVVGESDPEYGCGEAFRWTKETGMVGLGSLPGAKGSSARAVSADGSVVVGVSGNSEAFRWTKEAGIVGLGSPAGNGVRVVSAVSADGSVVVGMSGNAEAFRWTEQDGIVSLGVLSGGDRYSAATGVSADGAIVVGMSHSASGPQAFVWDAAHGMRSLRELLEYDLGSRQRILNGWKLSIANAISADGRVIVGSGVNPKGNREAWLARVNRPEPTARIPNMTALHGTKSVR